MMQSIDKILGDLSNGVNFAATLRKAAAAQHEEDSDVDSLTWVWRREAAAWAMGLFAGVVWRDNRGFCVNCIGG